MNTVPLYLHLASLVQLPSKCSRHNTPTQAHALTKAVSKNSSGNDEAFVVIPNLSFLLCELFGDCICDLIVSFRIHRVLLTKTNPSNSSFIYRLLVRNKMSSPVPVPSPVPSLCTIESRRTPLTAKSHQKLNASCNWNSLSPTAQVSPKKT